MCPVHVGRVGSHDQCCHMLYGMPVPGEVLLGCACLTNGPHESLGFAVTKMGLGRQPGVASRCFTQWRLPGQCNPG
jgi:hypothetical protein